ncbi:MAG: hypothetical protein ACKO0M_15795 [Cyanobium sp.]
MDLRITSLRPRRRRSSVAAPSLLPGAMACSLALAITVVPERPVQAGSGMGSIVRAFCLSAFENEMSLAGKNPPEGMASFACDCVEQRLRSGGTIDSARSDCRQATARRYPI